MLRDHSQHNGNKLTEVAASIVDSHILLLPQTPQPPARALKARAPADGRRLEAVRSELGKSAR
jgi:hypothetical protein